MPKKSIHTEVDGRKLTLSNPQKVLYPDKGITKAEVIQYFLSVSDYMLPHIKNRPITLIRFPDGIDKNIFYAKNKPDWTPEWIASTMKGEKDYVLVQEKATIIWIANLAGLEIHPMNVRAPQLTMPDQFIYDLDPSESFDFPALKDLALLLRDYLISYGYRSYIKTSGSKGLHIYIPLKPIYDEDDVYNAFEKITKEFIRKHKEIVTLRLSKDKRKGKVLLDIYRNRKSQSCVTAYSLRGKPGAPVSMPFHWENIDDIHSSQDYDIHSAVAYLKENGDAWKDIWSHPQHLHTDENRKAETLSEYDDKRNFTKTSEPTGTEDISDLPADGYVVQLHDASNLHYDLRLAENGVLLSWALPKGFPHEPGVKRLAVRTEDHPMKYLRYEGVIPKGEYGGGQMWIFDSGRYEVIERTDKKIKFRLLEGELAGEYVIYNTKGDQWIIELKEDKKIDLKSYIDPMLAQMGDKIPTSKDHFFEIKWDGIRAIFVIDDGKLTIYSRSGNDITEKFPELASLPDDIECVSAVMDGEIVYLDDKGRPDFSNIVGRIHVSGERKIELASKKQPGTVYLFDMLYLDARDCRKAPCEKRREWLKTILKTGDTLRFSEAFEDGKSLFAAIEAQSMEGIICKLKNGAYTNGARSMVWSKIKVRTDDEAYVIGYTAGNGDRKELLGALHLAKKTDNGGWRYMGKVGTGWDAARLKRIHERIAEVPESKKLIKTKIDDAAATTWINPDYMVELSYASMSSNDTYREPVFKKMKKASEKDD